MAHGTPDWGLVGPKRTTYGLDDMGELAVRLGSPSTWDRRGDVLYWSDFRNGVEAMETYYSGLPGLVNLVTEHARQGAYSVRLEMDDILLREAGLMLSLPLPVDSGVGIEFSFSNDNAAVYWEAWLEWATMTDSWRARVQFDNTLFPNGRLRYYDDTGNYEVFAEGIVLNAYAQPGHVLKMVVDMGATPTPQYVRAILNEVQYDLRGIGMWRSGAGGAVNMVARCLLRTGEAVIHFGYLDCVMITENEPA